MHHIASPAHLFFAAQTAFTRVLISLLCLLVPTSVFAAFGLTDNGTTYGVDSGAGLVFQVSKTDGSITSIVYNGTEYRSATPGRNSQIASGLGTPTTVTAATDGTTYVKIVAQTDVTNAVVSNLTQYLVVRPGDNTIYMATYTTAEPAVGELRWITRLNQALIPNGPGPSDLSNNTGAVESSDVFGLADGTTRSKYYGDTITHGKDRAMDLTYCGATGPGIGCWMVFGNRESSSGGPFFRDIENQAGGDQEIYNYMNSGHNQTEPTRVGNVLHGPYALVFTTGAPPTLPLDFSWMGSLGLNGWVPASARGAVSGTATGIPAGFQGVVGFANTTAQYWTVINADGTYTCSGLKPGSYTATLYKGELGVATSTVTVAAGATSTLNLASTETTPSTIFRIGEWDGTPAGFLNADKIVQMHPQDVRMSPWGPITYTVGADNPSSFPAIQFRGANSPTTIRFNLAPNQITNLTVRIGLTCAYNSGRPSITVNSFTPTAPGASNQPSSRSFTIGTYRGNNALFTYAIPASALVVGTNTMTITPVSGSADLGTWLSAGWAYDAVELDGPIATPTITYVGSTPLVISGTAEPGRNITVTLDGLIVVGSTVASSPNGAWSITYSAALAPGSHSVTAAASDNAGNTSPASTTTMFDNSIPMPVIATAIGDTATYVSGATTSDRVFTFTGTAGAGNTVTLTRIGIGVIGSATADSSGSWTFDYTSVSLPDGANSFYATASNGTANSASSSVFTLNLAGQPRIAIMRQNPAFALVPDTIGSVVFRVTFNQTVSGVTSGAFDLAVTGSATGTVAGVSASSGTTFDVTVSSLAGAGPLRLVLTPVNGIVDGGGNPESGYTAGQAYTLVTPTTGSGTWIQPASGGLWSDPINWQGAVIADGNAASANFATLDLTANNTVHLDSPRTVTSATFGDTDPTTPASWTLDNNGNNANTLTLAGTVPTIAVNALGTGATATISASLAGTGGLTKTGAGTLILTSTNPLTGPLNVNTGFLQIAPGAIVNLGNNPVNTALNTQLNVIGGSFTAGGMVSALSSSVVINGGAATLGSFRTASDFGAFLRINGGTLAIGDVNIQRNSGAAADFTSGFIVAGTAVANATTIELGSNNSTGAMSIEGNGSLTATGPITIANQATGGRGGAMRVINNGTFTSTDTALGILMCRNNGGNANNVASATFTGGVSTAEKFTLGFDSTVTAGSATITVNGGTLYLGSGGIVKNGASTLATTLAFSSGTVGAKANWSTALPITLPTAGNVSFNAADATNAPFNITLNGVLSGAGGFTKTGAGTLTLTAANTYSGATTINGGTLFVSGNLPAATNGISINSGGTLAGNGLISRPITLNSGGFVAPAGVATVGMFGCSSLTWNGGGALALDLGAGGRSDQLFVMGALTKGTSGSYTLLLNPTAPPTPGMLYTVASFGSTTFAASDLVVGGLPDGFAGTASINGTKLQVLVVARPVITSAISASGMFGAPFNYTITANNTPTSFSATGLPPGLSIDANSGVISGTLGAAGTFNVALGATNIAGTGLATLTLTVAPAPAAITFVGSGTGANHPVRLAYDGTPKTPPITTSPAGVPVIFTFNGSTTPPTLPGTYNVVATVNDPNYSGTAESTLVITTTVLVQHAPNLDGGLDGSLQLLTGEGFVVNGSSYVAGDLLLPGTPTVQLNGNPTLGGTQDASGAATPTNYTVTLNDGAVVRTIVRRVDPIVLPVVAAPPAPTGTRSVSLNDPSQTPGDFTTLRDLTLNSNVGLITVPPGTYGNFNVYGGSGLVLGVPGAEQPAIYNLQNLNLNGNSQVQIVGPVILTLAFGTSVNGSIVGNADHPEWLMLQVYSGDLGLGSNVSFNGYVAAPTGTVTINGGSVLTGEVISDRLAINSLGLLKEPSGSN